MDILPQHVSNKLSALVLALVHKLGGSRNASVLTSLSITGILAAHTYWKFVRVPRHLQGLPRIPFTFTIRSMFKKRQLLEQIDASCKILCKNAFQRGLVDSLDECPKMWTEWRSGKWQVMLANPLDLRDFHMDHSKFEKPQSSLPRYTYDKLFGSTLGLLQTPEWKTQRKIINPAFRRGWATSLFSEPTMNLLSRFDEFAASHEPVDVSLWMRRVTLDAMSSVIMGFNLDGVNKPHSPLIKIYERLLQRVFDPASNVFGGNLLSYSKRMKQFHTDLRDFNSFVYEWIDKTTMHINDKILESEDTDNRNLLEMMVAAQLKDPAEFSREDLRSNIVGFFVAGHDTTSTALTAAIYLLGMNPRVQEKARMEVMKIMGDPKAKNSRNIHLATNKQHNEMRYLTCVIKEVMRVYSLTTSIPRVLMSDHTFPSSGLTVPKGTIVTAHPWNIHHRNEYWNNSATEFIPERWDALSQEAQPIPLDPSAHNYTWTPFGGGQRICIGQQFSIVEQRVILSALLQQYSWRVVGNEPALSGTPTTHTDSLITFEGIFVELTPVQKHD